MAILQSQYNTLKNVVNSLDASQEIKAIGITNQRETVVVWDRKTGKPIYNAIVWQDRRTASYCEDIRKHGYEATIKQKTGLVIDAYFSATKLHWILENVPHARERAEKGDLCFGTVDSWLIFNLTQGKVHVTDVSNASRTMLCNIHTLTWDEELLTLFKIPKAILPEIKSSSEKYGTAILKDLNLEIPITGIAGDQQAALFGQLCIQKGMLKNTYGTGCFMLMNTGNKPVFSKNNLLTTVAWKIGNEVTYALEGSVFVGGAAVQWLRDELEFFDDASAIEELASQVVDSDGIILVPAFTGLGAPYWDPYARGMLIGITRRTTKAHIALATLEGIALQVCDIVKAMEEDASLATVELRVDGGAAANNVLLQSQANLANVNVVRSTNLESTALGAAYLAGLAVGVWNTIDELVAQWQIENTFEPQIEKKDWSVQKRKDWKRAVERAKNWVKP